MLNRCVIVLAYLGLSLSTIAVLTSVVGIYNLDDYIVKTYAPKSDETHLYLKTAGLIFLTSFALINFLNLTSCICLLIGALQKKKNLLVPYLVVTSLYILIYIGFSVYFFLSTRQDDLKNGIIAIAVLIINIYCIFVVFSLHRLLKLREENYPAFLRETNRQQQMAQPTYDSASYSQIA